MLTFSNDLLLIYAINAVDCCYLELLAESLMKELVIDLYRIDSKSKNNSTNSNLSVETKKKLKEFAIQNFNDDIRPKNTWTDKQELTTVTPFANFIINNQSTIAKIRDQNIDLFEELPPYR